MSSRTLFSLRMIRCPACHARLPVQGGETIVACEYCDARVEISREPRATTSPGRTDPRHGASNRATHFATPHYSGLAWVVFAVPVLSIIGVAFSLFLSTGGSALWEALSGAEAQPSDPTIAKRVDPPQSEAPVLSTEKEGSVETPGAAEEPEQPVDNVEPDAGTETPEDDARNAGTKSAQSRPSPAPKQPEGPVVSVAEAKKLLEPEVLRCMKEAGVHRVSARMGNKEVGGVSILTSAAVAKPRVDGIVVSLPATKLGRCINDAGRKVRTRAFKSNYIIIDVRNPSVRDPLGELPEQPARKDIEAALAPIADELEACGKKHGEEGQTVKVSLRIDGPTGKLTFARPIHTSKAFNKCVERLYKTISFPKAKRYDVDYTHSLQL